MGHPEQNEGSVMNHDKFLTHDCSLTVYKGGVEVLTVTGRCDFDEHHVLHTIKLQDSQLFPC